MSDENRTEAPTIKRIAKARSEGKFPAARELTSSLLFFVSLFIFEAVGAAAILRFIEWTRSLRSEPLQLDVSRENVLGLLNVFSGGFTPFSSLFIGLTAVSLVVPLLVAVVNRGWVFMPEKLAPDLSRLTPRLAPFWSLDTLWRLGLAAIQVTGTLFILAGQIRKIAGEKSSLTLPPEKWTDLIHTGLVPITIQLAVLFILLGIGDLFYQRWKYRRDLRMTREEVMRETKEE